MPGVLGIPAVRFSCSENYFLKMFVFSEIPLENCLGAIVLKTLHAKMKL